MNEAFVIDREFLFKENIYEITSISIEENHRINGTFIEGEFTVSGDYRLHEISINKDDFCFKVPFSRELKSNIDLDTVSLEITDFNYDFKNDDELSVHIEYVITAEESILEFEDKEKLEEFLKDEDVDVVDFSDERQDEPIVIDEALQEEKIENKIDHSFIMNKTDLNDNYIKYHVHTVTMNDTIESICSKYSINLNTLKKYNDFEALELNMKLLIPDSDES